MEQLFNMNCLDFLKSQQCKDLIKNRKVVIVTDPPFNIGYHYNTYNDRQKEQNYLSFLKNIFTEINLYGLVVIHYPETLYKIAFELQKVPSRVISWVYNSNTPRQHRDIAFFDVMPNFTQVLQPYKNPKDKRIQDRIKNGKTGCKLYDWWNINQVKNVSKNNMMGGGTKLYIHA